VIRRRPDYLAKCDLLEHVRLWGRGEQWDSLPCITFLISPSFSGHWLTSLPCTTVVSYCTRLPTHKSLDQLSSRSSVDRCSSSFLRSVRHIITHDPSVQFGIAWHSFEFFHLTVGRPTYSWPSCIHSPSCKQRLSACASNIPLEQPEAYGPRLILRDLQEERRTA